MGLTGLKTRVSAATLALVVMASMMFGLGGGDIWWHIAAGRHVVETGSWLRTDPFAYTSVGPVRYTEWLAQVLEFGAWKLAGEPGLIVLHGLLVSALALVSFDTVRRDTTQAAAWSVVVLAVVASHPALAGKPQIFSYLGFAISLRVVDALSTNERFPGWKLMAGTCALFLAWGSLHRGGLIGIAALCAVAFDGLIRRDRARVLRATALALAGLTCLCINPYGFAYITSSFDVVGRASLRDFVAEWQPMSLELLLTRHFALLPLVALFALGQRARPRFDAMTWIALGTAFLAWRGARLTPYLALALVPHAARGLDFAMSKMTGVRLGLRSIAVCALAVGSLGYSYASRFSTTYMRLGVVHSRVPVDLVDFLARERPRGNVFNPVDFGGYLLFRLGPGGRDAGREPVRVFVDGRYDTVFSDALCLDAFLAPNDPEVFARLREEHDITWVVHRWNGFDDRSFAFLEDDPSWHVVYWDDVGVVRVRESHENTSFLARTAFVELSPSTVITRLDSMTPTLAQEIVAHAARTPRSAAAQALLAEVHARSGRADEATAARTRARDLLESRRPLIE